MELLEIRNNLIKLAYNEEEKPTLGQFVALTGNDKSYVAQYVNLKADNINNFAVARLMFSFTSDGVVSEYDGSVPSIKSNIVALPANELLDLIPVETPIKIGQISGSTDIFNVDISVFEHNFPIFCENDYEKHILISNFVRQLFRLKEKSIIIDTDSIFEEYPSIAPGKDFKLPLNSDLIDFIFNHELKETDASTKVVIQDIFYAVQQYIKSLEHEFLPVENFIDVITAQYKETQMPELALLKNKLLKYKDAGIFVNDEKELEILKNKLNERNCILVDIKDIDEELQKEVINYIHKVVETFDKYVYYFVSLNDNNSDKKLLKKLLNNNHVFSVIFASHQYKYASELKSHAQNLMLFAPQTIQHDFAAYNTFLNKLNLSECIIYGKLTQGIPLIVSPDNLDLDLTEDDVFGERQRFVPAIEEDVLSGDDIYAINNLQEAPELDANSLVDETIDYETASEEKGAEQSEEEENVSAKNTLNDEIADLYSNKSNSDYSVDKSNQDEPSDKESNTVLENDSADFSEEEYEEVSDDLVLNSSENADDGSNYKAAETDDLSFMDELTTENSIDIDTDIPEENSDELTEDDLDFIETENAPEYEDNDDEEEYQSTPVVPVYDTDDDENSESGTNLKSGDRVSHPKYGEGTVEKTIRYGNKTLCSIDFDNVGKRLLDPSVSDFEKI